MSLVLSAMSVVELRAPDRICQQETDAEDICKGQGKWSRKVREERVAHTWKKLDRYELDGELTRRKES